MTPTPFDLLGTEEPSPERRLLRAGPLSVVLEGGQLRDIRWHGVLALRGIAYLLRDAAWGTLPVAVSGLEVREGGDSFAVSYEAQADAPAGRLHSRARIEGRADGILTFEVDVTAETDFTTNRTGLVVLHPDTAAGQPLRVGHGDGTVEESAFPLAISPDQPAFEITSLEHGLVAGVTARVEFEGGLWEMEDQRNWSDASFKTYVRPLAWPFPYVIPAGTTERQAVTLRFSGRPQTAGARATATRPTGRTTMPPFHLRLAEGLSIPDALPLPGLAQGLILRLRARDPAPARIAAAAALAAREGMILSVEAVFPQKDPNAEVAACLAALAGHPVGTLLVTAERDFRTRPSGTMPAGEAPLEATIAALRAAGFQGRIGAGTPAFFTEFNRNPPPAADLAFFGINPIIHAADDLSVMETLGVLPAIMDSAAHLRPGVPLWPGPLAIAPTVNPYGMNLAQTDGTTRTCMAMEDPRHGALFGAAHLLAVIAGTLPGAEALAPLHANGPTGVVRPDGAPHPLAFVLAELARAEGASLTEPPQGDRVAALAWDRDGSRTILLASTAPGDTEIALPHSLEAAHRLAPGPQGWHAFATTGPALRIGPYATLRLTAAAGAPYGTLPSGRSRPVAGQRRAARVTRGR